MNQNQFKKILRNAVLAAIPLSAQSGCMPAAEPVKTEPTKPKPINIDDPCRKDEATRKSATEAFTAQINLVKQPVSAEQCIALCKEAFEKNRVGGQNDLAKLEKIQTSNCSTKTQPFTTSPFRGGDSSKPSTLVSCEVEYTAIHAPYTCTKIVPGRMPNGLQTGHNQATAQNSIARYLADMTTMETAAITAFKYLVKELKAYGAPSSLIAHAQLAVEEEQRHAEMAGLLAAAHQAEVSEILVADFALRSLFEIALENAIEGCINETFAAACGLWQSEHAQMPVFKEVIAHITDEEMGHAALSWEIHEWLMPQLTSSQQQSINNAQAEAVETLITNFKQKGDPAQQLAFGLPDKTGATAIFAQLQNSVWQDIPSVH